eukprot:GHVQ01015987.1.p1 GENE.GHVQ01015987.1~~GHVQ01015987.1.p1  ORF type:complete len:327 (-),score=15.62 GHVQ01015987.1:276-1256(-)
MLRGQLSRLFITGLVCIVFLLCNNFEFQYPLIRGATGRNSHEGRSLHRLDLKTGLSERRLDPWMRGVQSPAAAASSPIPLPTSGTCEAGTTYVIQSVQDLEALKGQWECVFRAGLEPLEVPLGRARGQFLKVLNTAVFNPLLKALTIEQYHQILATRCPKTPNDITFIDIAGEAAFPNPVTYGLVTIGDIGPMKPQEATPPYDPSGLIVDYRADMKSICEQPSAAKIPYAGAFPSNPPPIPNNLVNVARIAGRSSVTGDFIWIQKSYSQDQINGLIFTIAYDVWTTAANSSVSPIQSGDPIGPIPNTYTYVQMPLVNLIKGLVPFY